MHGLSIPKMSSISEDKEVISSPEVESKATLIRSPQMTNLLQIQFDDMKQFSSRLAEEKNELQAKNQELSVVLSLLQKTLIGDAAVKCRMREEMLQLRRELDITKAQLKEAITARDILLSDKFGYEVNKTQKESLTKSISEPNEFSSTKPSSRPNLCCSSKPPPRRNLCMQQYTEQGHGDSFRIDGISKRNRFHHLQKEFSEKALGEKKFTRVKRRNSLHTVPEESESNMDQTISDDHKPRDSIAKAA